MKCNLWGLIFTYTVAIQATNAVDNTAEKYFKRGLNVFRKGDFSRALDWFEKARKIGMAEAKLAFNLGVTYYKLGRYREAKKMFVEVANHRRLAGLAYYNLGLVSLAEDEEQESIRWFRQSFAKSEDKKLKALAGQKLIDLQKKSVERALRSWTVLLHLGAGNTDNLVDVSTGTERRFDDSFYKTYIAASGPVSGTLLDGWRMDAMAYRLKYDEQSASDIDLYSVYVARVKPWDSWRTETGLGLQNTTLGGSDYLQTAKLELRARKSLSSALQLQLRYRYSAINALEDLFSQLEGVQHRIGIELKPVVGKSRQTLGYRFEHNEREDLQIGNSFNSFSPNRNRLYWKLRVPLSAEWEFSSDMHAFVSQYRDANTSVTGAQQVRKDQQYSAGVEITRRVYKGLRLKADLRYTNNQSNLDDFDYQRYVLSFGITSRF